jgi:hypothetical protein
VYLHIAGRRRRHFCCGESLESERRIDSESATSEEVEISLDS